MDSFERGHLIGFFLKTTLATGGETEVKKLGKGEKAIARVLVRDGGGLD